MNKKLLKITRYRRVSSYLYEIEMLSMKKGFSSTEVNSLRWKRLELCISSIEFHLLHENKLFGVFC